MKAVAFTRYPAWDDSSGLQDVELPRPQPGPRDILVEVRAVAVNPLDNRVRTPKARIEAAPRVPGWDGAGVVIAVGAEVTRFAAGDRVYYAGEIGRAGSFAECQLVDERLAGHMAAAWSFEQAAALPLATITAWEALFDRLRLPTEPARNAGRSILIIGAAGGVGSVAVQLARAAGLVVIATASRAAGRQGALDLGAHHAIDHAADIPAQLAAIGHPEVDHVLILGDTDAHFATAAAVARPQGSICTIVEAKHPVDINLLWDKSLSFAWEMVFTRTDFRTHDMARHGEILDAAARMADAGRLRPVIADVLAPLDARTVHGALERLRAGGVAGKIVIARVG